METKMERLLSTNEKPKGKVMRRKSMTYVLVLLFCLLYGIVAGTAYNAAKELERAERGTEGQRT